MKLPGPDLPIVDTKWLLERVESVSSRPGA
jgi:hypothetical protein